jgi:crossover junction endodeoxyribonuclease RusA
VRVELPIRTWSEANARVHWATRARRAREQRRAARICVRAALARSLAPPLPLTVTLTRLAPKRLDTDNLAISLKAVRDGVADALGLDDGDERLVWRYAQERLRPGHYGIRVEVS